MLHAVFGEVLKEVNKRLPPFNNYLLNGYRQEQIQKIPDFLALAFAEATKLFKGEVDFKGYRILTPEDCIRTDILNPKYSANIDITRTENVLVEFMFEHEGEPFSTQLYVPYLIEDCIHINGSKYFIMLSLTDKVFYHIAKEHGLGIKILKAQLQFLRNVRFQFRSRRGITYSEHLVITKIHMRHYKYTAEDIRTALILYPLVQFGFDETLRKFGIDPKDVRFTNEYDPKDRDNEYFTVRLGAAEDKPDLYLKVSINVLASRFDIDKKIQMRVIAEILYVCQYFDRYKETIYDNNVDLAKQLMNDSDENVAWKIILGKSVYGINYVNEIQVAGLAKQHLDSLETYLDPLTIAKLESIGAPCKDVYDLIFYIANNIDEYVGNYYPSNLYNKQFNVLDLLLGNAIRAIFNKVYKLTNNRKGGKSFTFKEVSNAFKIGSRLLSKLYAANQIVTCNPSHYNDNALATVTSRKNRATFSSTIGGPQGAKKKKKNKNDMNRIRDPEHRMHSSMAYIESIAHIQGSNPTISGTINVFCPIKPTGDIILEEETVNEARTIDPYTMAI